MPRANCLVAILFIIVVCVAEAKEQVRFVSVVFRHGNRAPHYPENRMYPTDPYFNDTFYPMGLGGLTNEGKQNAYKLGEGLRKRYNDFLGDIYIPEDVRALSSDVPRTKMSLLLVLAALYPPAELQKWNPQLNWQPIPYDYIPKNNDTMFRALHNCPRFAEEYVRINSLPDVIEMTETFRPFMGKLSNMLGRKFENITDLTTLYNGLVAEASMNLTIPEWTKGIFPDGILRDAAILQYALNSYNDLLKKISSGKLLKMMIDDMNATANATSKQPRKISLLSGHEANVASLLITLGLFKPHAPAYSSAVIIELVYHDGKYYVKVVHYLGIPAIFEELEIPHCEKLCPLDKFVDLMKNVTSTDDQSECMT